MVDLGGALSVLRIPQNLVGLLVDSCLGPTTKGAFQQSFERKCDMRPLACRRKRNAPLVVRLLKAASFHHVRDLRLPDMLLI